MNGDEAKAHFMTAAVGVLSWAAGRYHLSQDQVGAIMSDVGYAGAAIAFLVKVASHWNMKKVPEAARVVGGVMLAIVGVCTIVAPARAADLKPIVKANVAPVFAAPSDLSNWSGFYAGVSMSGLNQGADVIGGGLASINAGGQLYGAQIGYMSVTNKQYLLGAEAMVAYQPNTGVPSVLDGSRWNGRFDLKAGGSLAGLIGTVQQPASGGVFNLGTLAANTMPYVHGGDWQRGGVSQGETGVGLYVPLNKVFLLTEYTYAPASGGLKSFQAVTVEVNWPF